MISKTKFEISEDEAYVRSIISPLTSLLDAPDELSKILRILEEFRIIFDLYKPLNYESEAAFISKIDLIVDRILTGDIPVTSCITTAREDPERQTMRPHYEDKPHYCVYYYELSKYSELLPQYRALLASFLPVQSRLQEARSTTPEQFINIFYNVGLCLRQLTDPTENEILILRELPTVALTPAQLCKRIEELFHQFGFFFKISGNQKRFSYLHRVLVWFETNIWEQRSLSSRNSTGSVRSSRHSEELDSVSEVHHLFSEPQELGSPINTRIFNLDNNESRRASEQDDDDADPIQDSGSTRQTVEIETQKASAFNAIDRISLSRRKARYVAQAIEMGNQKLPVTHATLTGFELRVLLGVLNDIDHYAWSDISHSLRLQIAAWGACRFFLGRGPDELSQIQRHAGEFLSASNVIVWYSKSSTIWLPCELPNHKPPEDQSRALMSQTGFILDIKNSLAPFLKKITSKNQNLFSQNFDLDFSELLRRLNQENTTTLTLNRVGQFLPGLISQLSPNDDVMSTYFTGRTPNLHNPSVYSAIPTRLLESLYACACDRVTELARIPRNYPLTPAFLRLFNDVEHFVGSLHVPKLSTVRMTVDDIRNTLEKSRNAAGTPVHELHNTYTAYVLLFLMATTGIRAVNHPIPAEFDIDRATGCCFISEKDTNGYRNARVVWLHPILLEQLDAYARHVTRLRQYLSLTNINALKQLDARNFFPLLSLSSSPNRENDQHVLQRGTSPLFMLNEFGGSPNSIDSKRIEELLGDHWQLRLVSLRHFIRTQLLLSGCSGVLIDALLGHAKRGESSWGRFSTLPPITWRKQISNHLALIMNKLNFEVIESPLLRS